MSTTTTESRLATIWLAFVDPSEFVAPKSKGEAIEWLSTSFGSVGPFYSQDLAEAVENVDLDALIEAAKDWGIK